MDFLINAKKYFFDLLVEFSAIGKQKDAGVVDVLSNPFSEPHHRQAFAASLRVPNDAALMALHEITCRLYSKILVVSARFLDAAVEHDKIMGDFEESLFFAELEQAAVETTLVSEPGFLPSKVVSLRGFSRAVP